MNSEPVSISTLMSAVSTAMATKAPEHADSPMATGDVFDRSVSDPRTALAPQ
jgi:hypothetical protein